ncbi:hypothetical protein LS73_006210 [Helicobacter muridarum]|uniref:Lipid/polyisoprenoid-binding YceI-like domain-containing protein n=1 Tax=Helicobacter muridarum TaxID=216 RepID=A0A4U8TIC2_9HELI|nr:hypothetical protein [Helicobacter muridarum]TLE00032.1 hypothetical protein LS73_006210 [Helicobacter muridarum]
MSKIVVGSLLSATASAFLHAATIDKSSVEVWFIGYKTPDMVDLAGTFKNIKYTFGKDAKTFMGTLQGASAVIVPTSSEIPDIEAATNNMNKVFFPTLLGKNNIQVTFVKVIEGDNRGVISARVSIGKESTIIPLEYEISDNKLTAKGRLDLHNFSNASKALKALSDAAAGHAGISWPNVDIIFKANIK